jgi:dienelactone hydrolase
MLPLRALKLRYINPVSRTLISTLLGLLFLLPLAAQVTTIHEDETRIPWTQAGPAGLDALLVYADLPGKRPLVVMTHGSSRDPEAHHRVTPWEFLPQARWFARRGFVVLVVVRRGYGSSGGEQDGAHTGHCPQTDYAQASRNAAQDLRTAVEYGSRLPQVDPARALAVGISTGGMATVALTADPPKNLVAAINFAGGRGSQSDHDVCNPDTLVAAYRDFGKHSRVPMLWIYAQNDKYFWPELAQRFDAAFRSSGGQDEFIQAPAFGDDGHMLFNHGIAIWTPIVDAFLKAHDLVLLPEPLPEVAPPNIPPPAGLSDRCQESFRNYLILGPHKAFAISPHHCAFSVAQINPDEARKRALENCNRNASASGEQCSVVFVEDSPLK